MKLNKYGNYDLAPVQQVACENGAAFAGWPAIREELGRKMAPGKVFVFDLYPGTDKNEVAQQLAKLQPAMLLDCEDCLLPRDKLEALFAPSLPEDPVFGIMFYGKLENCFDAAAIAAMREQIAGCEGPVFVYGTGAALVTRGDVLVYMDLPRWEIQLRYRGGMPNWQADNADALVLEKFKRGYFVEWRLADRHKRTLLDELDYLMETTVPGAPKMAKGGVFRTALEGLAEKPFRLKPYFDPGVWGGQWMKENFALPEGPENYAWSFDGVPEENSLLLAFGEVTLEIPAMDLVLFAPQKLLGERVHARFGAEFPIRFDLLDTMEGGNLSLQVHPLTEYIQENFGMHYTQDESYYILDADETEETYVYLGLKNGVDKEKIARDLYSAQAGKCDFPAEEYVNKIAVKKHDHLSIPAGTVHCSGKNTMVLEISATPYIFTFKLWDWGRMGLDGRPRPTHLAHGLNNIQWNRDTDWVQANLLDQATVVGEQGGCVVECTGLHEREFIETRRYTITGAAVLNGAGSVTMLNLVDGEQATISSPGGAFAPFEVHYAETAVVPASVGEFTVCPSGPAQRRTVKIIAATVR